MGVWLTPELKPFPGETCNTPPRTALHRRSQAFGGQVVQRQVRGVKTSTRRKRVFRVLRPAGLSCLSVCLSVLLELAVVLTASENR